MSAVANDNTDQFTPFFTDPRSMLQKLKVERREWRPHQPEHGCPSLITGLVLDRDIYLSTIGKDEPKPCPTLQILDADLATEWSVIGFHGWLRRGVEKENPKPGDFILISFNGLKPSRKDGENDAYTYQVIVEPNPAKAERQPDTTDEPYEVEGTPSDPHNDAIPF